MVNRFCTDFSHSVEEQQFIDFACRAPTNFKDPDNVKVLPLQQDTPQNLIRSRSSSVKHILKVW